MDDQAKSSGLSLEVGGARGGFAGIAIEVLFWSLLIGLIVLHFAQLSPTVFGVKLWNSWNPEFRAAPAVHAGMACSLSLLWWLTKRPTVQRWVVTILLILFFAVWTYYWFTRQTELFYRPTYGSAPDLILGLIMFAIAIYLTWVHWGPIFPCLAAVFIGYVFIAHWLPGPLRGPTFGTMEVFTRIIQKMISELMDLMSGFLWLLIFWGLLMNAAGAGVAILGMARSLSRTGIAGGPAIGALLASAITGSFVGGGTSNVAVTGPITIPAMRKAGYSAEQAGAVEAIASNASGITPPVLGSVAFIMAEIVGVSYIEIIVMAMVPAFLWFLGAGVYIYAHAQRHRDVIEKIHEQELESGPVGWSTYLRSTLLMVIPVAIIVGLVINGNTLRWGTSWAFVATVILGISLRVETNWGNWYKGIRMAAFYASSVTVIIIVLAIIADAITYTGLGGRLGGIVEDVSQGEMIIAGAIMIFFGVILGAGLPALAIYFIMAITFAPVLSKMGVDQKVSHFVAFYMGNLGTIIPPVAGSALVAAIVANTTYWPVCKAITKMSWPMWVFPILFLVAPQLLLVDTDVVGNGTTLLIIASCAFAIVGVQVSTAGWLFKNMIMPIRVILYANFFLLALALRNQSTTLMMTVIGITVICSIIAFFTGTETEYMAGKKQETAAPPTRRKRSLKA